MYFSTIRIQQIIVVSAVLLFILKIVAYYLTQSVAVLTDALESIVNVVASIIGLYSIILSSKPRDEDHPYGHRKVEFISSAIEGVLIAIAGFIIIYHAILNFLHPHTLANLDIGIVLVALSAIINYVLGWWCKANGKKNSSPVLMSTGEHLQADTYSTLGLIVGIIIIMNTNYTWIDSVVAILFSFFIIFSGYKIIRKSLSGIMDEADAEVVNKIITIVNKNRSVNWIDIHNLRVIDYAGFYHVDCHLTIPYYLTIKEGHIIMDELMDLLKNEFENNIEFFIHIDGCIATQCSLCSVSKCSYRSQPFVRNFIWTKKIILANTKHTLNGN
ncbi:MAG: cation transporter [Bacteroidia bacterium]|nr:cation transporter [Bacteroidia bacterium]